MKKLSTLAKKKLVIAALDDIKARDIQAIDVRRITAVFDWIVVASAESARQTKALARHVRDELRAAGSSIVGSEGEETGEWILVDAGDVVVHVMQPAVREYYNLEELWSEGRFDAVVNSSAPVAARPRRVTTKATKGTKKKAKGAKAKSPVRRKRAS
jgi:ribosome-associated protein